MKGGPLRQINDRFRRPARAEMRDVRAKLVPLGADQPFDPIPVPTPYTEEERNGLTGLWDGSHTGKNGRYKGMLDAEIVDGKGDEDG